jgi:hypothetical protein
MESGADGAPSEPWPTQLGLIGFGFRWPKKTEEDGSESLETEVEQVLEEARVVLPGIQALFGIQLSAVSNQRFDQALGDPGKLRL